jgi:hypothetical protein
MGYVHVSGQTLVPALFAARGDRFTVLDQPTGTGKTVVSLLCAIMRIATPVPLAIGMFDFTEVGTVSRIVFVRCPPALSYQWEDSAKKMALAFEKNNVLGIKIRVMVNPTEPFSDNTTSDIFIAILSDKNKQDPRYTKAMMSGMDGKEYNGKKVTAAQIMRSLTFDYDAALKRIKRQGKSMETVESWNSTQVHDAVQYVAAHTKELEEIQHRNKQIASDYANTLPRQAAILIIDEAHLVCDIPIPLGDSSYDACQQLLLVSATISKIIYSRRHFDSVTLLDKLQEAGVCNVFMLTRELIQVLRDGLRTSLATATLLEFEVNVLRPFGLYGEYAAAATLSVRGVLAEFILSLAENIGLIITPPSDVESNGRLTISQEWLQEKLEVHMNELNCRAVYQGSYAATEVARLASRTQSIISELRVLTSHACGVCQMDFTNYFRPALTSCCMQRSICAECLISWSTRTKKCPLCRRPYVVVGLVSRGKDLTQSAHPSQFSVGPGSPPSAAIRLALASLGGGLPVFELVFERLITALAQFALEHGSLHILVATPVDTARERLAQLLEGRKNVSAQELCQSGGAKRKLRSDIVTQNADEGTLLRVPHVTVARQNRIMKAFTDCPANQLSVIYTVQSKLVSTTDGLDIPCLDGIIFFGSKNRTDQIMHQTSGRLSRMSRGAAKELFIINILQ